VVDYIRYRVKATLLTPLHIGTGRVLLHEYDFAVHKGHIWRLNEDALLEIQNVDDLDLAEHLARTPPARLLKLEDFRPDNSYFRYIVRGVPRSVAEGAQVREQLKDAYDRLYLPGTSLKGALRTAIAWYAWEALNLRPRRTHLKPNPRFAAQGYERKIFGKNPNHDLLRALHVEDSKPVGADALVLINARVLHRNGRMASPIELEAIAPDTVFHLTFKLDLTLFSEWARQRNFVLRGREWLERLPDVVRAHTRQRIADEIAWFQKVPGAETILDFYRRLQKAIPPGNRLLLQVGWGTGWDDKTLGSRLRADPRFMEEILRPRRQGGYDLARGRRRRGDPFPKSRRVAVQITRTQDNRMIERPVAPLGWLLVEIEG